MSQLAAEGADVTTWPNISPPHASAGRTHNTGTISHMDTGVHPNIVLHDHLDGGVRCTTLFELADNDQHRCFGYHNPDELAAAIHEAANSGDLNRYLAAFTYTTGVLQTGDALERVAYEAVCDLGATGAIYTELRFDPYLHTKLGHLTIDDAIDAVLAGLRRGERDAAGPCGPTTARLILSAMRGTSHTALVAHAALRWRDRGVVGYDLAGHEHGNPASDIASVFDYLALEELPVTIHAGEAGPLEYITDAIACGAQRIGHGVALETDITNNGCLTELGDTATRIADNDITLEMCPTSNIHTGAATSYDAHPIALFYDTGIPVTISCDNRTMSNTDMTREHQHLTDTFGWGPEQYNDIAHTALAAAFCDNTTRERLRQQLEQHTKPSTPDANN